ncbi:uncharacterized protein LOC144656719 [Oculina patagonica]
MGNKCSNRDCKVSVKSGKYCNRCYSLKTGKCCECFRDVDRHRGQGIYCTECYDVKYPPPLKLNVKYQRTEFNYYSRDDRVLEELKAIVNNAQEGRTNQGMITDTPREQQKSHWDRFLY